MSEQPVPAGPDLPDQPDPPDRRGLDVRRLGVAGTVIAAVLGALAVNLIVLGIGHLCGGDFTYTQSGKKEIVNAEAVAILTGLPLFTGLTATAVLAMIWPAAPKVAAVVGPGLALLTIGIFTVPADFDTVSTLFLALMHVALALIALAAVTAIEVLRARQAGNMAA